MGRAGRQLRRKRHRQEKRNRRMGRGKTHAVQEALGELHVRLAALDLDEWPQRDEMLSLVRAIGALYIGARLTSPEEAGEE